VDTLVVLVVVTALLFDFTNGFHDTANAVATSIATGALSPRVAVFLSGLLNLVGALLSVQVALTISSGLVDEAKITTTVIFAGLVGAILWNLVTWLVGLPSSSSHALFGGLIGATWVAAGAAAINFDTLVAKVLIPAVLAPVVAGLVALVGTYLAYRITERADQGGVGRGFKVGQIVSASMVSLAHGTNDAQKTMGIITLTLITAGTLPEGSSPPLWVILSAGFAIALGTAVGGWRIIRTLGMRITQIHPLQGFAAQTSSASVILVSSHLGFPLSTTQVCSGAIFGAGAGRRLARVHWGVAGQMAIAWTLTLPSAAIVGGVAAQVALISTLGTILVALVAIAIAAGIYLLSRRDPIDAENVDDVPVDPTAVPTAA
jgi:PiT family inorganic phosphate transporter